MPCSNQSPHPHPLRLPNWLSPTPNPCLSGAGAAGGGAEQHRGQPAPGCSGVGGLPHEPLQNDGHDQSGWAALPVTPALFLLCSLVGLEGNAVSANSRQRRLAWRPACRHRNAAASCDAGGRVCVAAGDVRVNWRSGAKPSSEVKAGDVISVAGKGRLEVKAASMTKKGKHSVQMVRYL